MVFYSPLVLLEWVIMAGIAGILFTCLIAAIDWWRNERD